MQWWSPSGISEFWARISAGLPVAQSSVSFPSPVFHCWNNSLNSTTFLRVLANYRHLSRQSAHVTSAHAISPAVVVYSPENQSHVSYVTSQFPVAKRFPWQSKIGILVWKWETRCYSLYGDWLRAAERDRQVRVAAVSKTFKSGCLGLFPTREEARTWSWSLAYKECASRYLLSQISSWRSA